MPSAKVFNSGNSQAVRLPKQFRVKAKELEIFRRGDELVLREKPASMRGALEIMDSLPPCLGLKKRIKDRPQHRKGL
jgi:antitoxin VapB